MPRRARLVVPDVPHHITQRGHDRRDIFDTDDDRRRYLALLTDTCRLHGTSCRAWCLMDNHLHLILVPATTDALRATVAGTHTLYTNYLNGRRSETGRVFQGRFGSVTMSDAHWVAAVRYVEMNPVRAGLCARAEDWPWSSARAHIAGVSDGLTDIAALGRWTSNWRAFLADGAEASDRQDHRGHS